MITETVGETLQKGPKKETSGNKKMPRNWQKRVEKSAAAQGEIAEIPSRKALKIQKILMTEHSEMLWKYKFWIYYTIYERHNKH